MKRLWIADVHANLPAFQAVLNDAGDVDEVVFLGDIVGYGPHPAECLDILINRCPKAVIGNHDLAILSRKGQVIPRANSVKDWDDWTLARLTTQHLSYLAGLPEEIETEFRGVRAKVLHRPPDSPYMHPNMPDDVLKGCFQKVPGEMIICAHSHYPIDRRVGRRRFICIPSVGQPRSGDPRAGYAVEEKNEIHFRLVDYDIERTVSDVTGINLPEPFSARWIDFIRTGHDKVWSRNWEG